MRIGEFSAQTGRDATAGVDDLADADRIPPHTRVATHRQLIPQIAKKISNLLVVGILLLAVLSARPSIGALLPEILSSTGACPLCRMRVSHCRGQPGAGSIAFVDVAEPGAEVGRDLEPHRALERFHVRDSEGRLISGASAFVLLWSSLPSWQWVARAVRRPGILPALEVGYGAFLVVRPVLAWAL